MKLYIYDHCPYCVKARMIFGLKDVPIEIITLLNDDEATPTQMIGQKMVPILQKEDNSFMPESMDIVHYIDDHYGDKPIIAKPQNDKIQQWLDKTRKVIFILAKPRWIKANLEEFKTEGAINYFTRKKESYEGEFEDDMKKSPDYIKEVETYLKELNDILYSEESTTSDIVSEDDIHLFAALRSLSIIKGINYPDKVKKYMENMSTKSKVPLHFDIAI